MQPYRTFSRKIGVFLLLCLLAGCSAARLGYSHGETVAYWWLDSYVDFESTQKPWVKQRLAQLFEWHRRTQLPDYAQLLTQWQEQLHQPATTAQISAGVEAVRKRMLVMLDKAAPDLADLALSLQPRQIAQIEKKFAANNEKYRNEYLSDDLEKRQLARYKQVMKHAEYWFGSFSREQEAKIRAASDARSFDGEMVMAMRLRQQRELIALLKKIQIEKPNRETAARMLREYVTASLTHFGDAKMHAASETYANDTIALATMVVNMTTPKQKAFAEKRVKEWVENCRAMTLDAGRAPTATANGTSS